MLRRLFFFHYLAENIVGLFWATWAITLIKSGQSFSQVCYSLAGWYLFTSILEIPTGIIADKYGRKASTLLGFGTLSLSFFLQSLFHSNFYITFILFSICGVSYTLISGAKDAWLLSFIKNSGKKSWFFNKDILGRLGTITGSFTGVMCLKISPSALWLALSIISFGVTFYGSKYLPSSPSNKPVETFKLDIKEVLQSLKFPPLLLFLMAMIPFGIESAYRDIIHQPFIIDISNGNLMHLAHLQAGLAFSRIAGNLIYKNFLSGFNFKGVFLIFGISAYIGAEIAAYYAENFMDYFVFMFGAVFFIGWYYSLRDYYINEFITVEKYRATILSIDSMILNLSQSIAALVIGMTLVRDEIRYGWLFAAGYLLISVALTVLGLGLTLERKRLWPALAKTQKLPR